MFDKSLLDILICPLSKADLVLDGNRLVSTDPATRRAYPIDADGIPHLLISDGKELPADEHAAVLARRPAAAAAGKPTKADKA